MSKLSKRREKRASQNKWILGEALTKRGRARKQARKSASTVEEKTGKKISPSTARQSGKISKKDLKGVEVTKKGGAFPKYAKESKKAGSFRSAFAKNCKGKGAGDSFTWDGRSYSCARASDKKKVAEPPKQKKNAPKEGPLVPKLKKKLKTLGNEKAPVSKKIRKKKKTKKEELVAIPGLGPEKKYYQSQKDAYEKATKKKRTREKLYNRSKKLKSAEERKAERARKKK